jgi:glycosyltransferase involved in cell wall biosynthesis
MLLFFATTLEFDQGGIARSVPRLACELAALGQSVVLVAPQPRESTLPKEVPSGLDLRLADNSLHLRQLLRDTIRGLPPGSIVYHAGIWSPWNHLCASLTRRVGHTLIASPRSSLDPWARRSKGLKKRLGWWLYARHDLATSTAIHATAELEAGYIRAAVPGVPVFVAPHGIDVPSAPAQITDKPDGPRRLLFLSRLNPKKGLEDLIEVFREQKASDWELIIAGNGEPAYEGALKARASGIDAIRFVGAVRDEEKGELYRSADAFVLPSYSENFGLVVAEALSFGLPVLTTTATPWAELGPRGAGWCVSPGVDGLREGLNHLWVCDREALWAMGQRGRDWVAEAFSWRAAATKWLEAVHATKH